jgi:hypothetical protein
MIRTADNQTIDPSEFASTVAPEMKYEMSIILRKTTAIQGNRGKCPRCHYVNSHAPAANGWIEWQVSFGFQHLPIINTITYSRGCEGQFQITEADSKHQDNDNSDDENDSTDDVWDNVANESESDEFFSDGDTAEDVEDIISPGSYVSFLFAAFLLVTLLDLVDQTRILQTYLMPMAYACEMALSSSAVYVSFFG